ncbi:MAG TPA: acyltransferase domain-containing protein, partial [Mycobacteriales bacterium]|nr:acyltransferase domain-containing protein [Mycobacteriales bacterium]
MDWTAGEVRLLTEAEPWPASDRPRRAGVSSFGVSGTNAHVIIEEPPVEEEEEPAVPAPPAVVPVLVSARGEAALRAQADRLRAHLLARPELSLLDVGLSTAVTRAQLERRAAVVAADRDAALAGLAALAAGQPAAGVVDGPVVSDRPVFVFPGQGAQWPGMAVGLLDSCPVFAAEIAACERALSAYVDWSLVDVLRGVPGTPPLERVDVVQPALFAVMVSLARLWRSYGVEPAAVVGHSQGEIAAAYVAGGLSLEDAARVVALRSQLVRDRLAGRGSMVSAVLAAEQMEARIGPYAGRVSVAAVNGPRSVVVAGDPADLADLVAGCERDGVRIRRLPVDYASHSAHVESIEAELLAALAPVRPRSGQVPFYSTVEGRFVDTAGLDGGYWYRNLRGRVGFEPAVRALVAGGTGCFLEMSPHPLLTVPVEQTVEALDAADRVAVVGSLRRDEGGPDRFVRSLARAHVAGVPVDWAAYYAGTGARRVPLPTYAFQRQSHWLAAGAAAGDVSAAGLGPVPHPVLTAAVPVADRDEWLLTGRLSRSGQPWTRDHALHGTVVVPGAALVELALAAGRHTGCPVLAELTVETPLVLAADDAVPVQVAVGAAADGGGRAVTVYSRPDGGPGTVHARGTLAPPEPVEAWSPVEWPPAGAEPVPVDVLHARLAAAGHDLWPAFLGLQAAWRDGADGYAEVVLPDEQAEAARDFGLHPALLDAALQARPGTARTGAAPSLELPRSWSGVWLERPGAARVRVRITPAPAGGLRVDLAGEDGEPVGGAAAVGYAPFDPAQLAPGRPGALFAVEWTPVTPTSRNGRGPARVAVLGADGPGGYADLDALERAVAGGTPAPEVVLAEIRSPAGSPGGPAAARAVAATTLDLLQRWLASTPLAGARLVLLTRGGVAVGDEAADLAVAPVCGLVRSAQAEQPGRFVLVDLDGEAAAPEWGALLDLEEPQLVLRSGRLLVPRLARVSEPAEPPSFDPDGIVLVTGGTGAAGALVTRHLAGTRGVRRLLLADHRGAAADGLVAELAAAGCEATVVDCDVADRDQLAALLDGLRYPLAGVVHLAGMADDALVGSLTADGLAAALRSTMDAAWHLDELTADRDLAAFVLFSSAAGLIGSPAQGASAAAAAGLDA